MAVGVLFIFSLYDENGTEAPLCHHLYLGVSILCGLLSYYIQYNLVAYVRYLKIDRYSPYHCLMMDQDGMDIA